MLIKYYTLFVTLNIVLDIIINPTIVDFGLDQILLAAWIGCIIISIIFFDYYIKVLIQNLNPLYRLITVILIAFIISIVTLSFINANELSLLSKIIMLLNPKNNYIISIPYILSLCSVTIYYTIKNILLKRI